MRSSNAQSDDTLAQINQRGKLVIHLDTYRTKTIVAQQFADQSPLGPKKRHEPEANQPESNRDDQRSGKCSDETTKETLDEPTDEPIEMLDNSTKAGAHDDKVVSNTTIRPVPRVLRAHSWNSSQGADYAYSEEAATARSTSADQDQERDREDIDQVIDLSDFDAEDKDHEDDTPEDSIQLEDPRDEVHHSKGNQNHEVIELEDLKAPDETDIQKAQPVTEDQDSPNTQESVSREHGRSSTPLEPIKVIGHKKRKPFGLFAASLGPDTESVVESVYAEPPQRLRDLVQKRRRERAKEEEPEKRTKYNLRPRRAGRACDQDSSLTRPSVDSDTREDERPTRHPQNTRSMTARKQERKSIPRSRAARKTALSSMGIFPKDKPHRAEPSRRIVQVVIPVTDKSGREFMPTGKSSTAVDEAQIKSGSRSAKVEVPSSRKRVLDVVLID